METKITIEFDSVAAMHEFVRGFKGGKGVRYMSEEEVTREPEPATEPNQPATTSTPQESPGTHPLQDAEGTGADALGRDPKNAEGPPETDAERARTDGE